MRRRRAAPHGEGVRSRAVALAPASGAETYEIIRRRLFQPLDADGEKARDVFSDLEMTGSAKPGTIVESRAYDDAAGRKRLSLAARSDLTIEA
jgi:hypothetical protein